LFLKHHVETQELFIRELLARAHLKMFVQEVFRLLSIPLKALQDFITLTD